MLNVNFNGVGLSMDDYLKRKKNVIKLFDLHFEEEKIKPNKKYIIVDLSRCIVSCEICKSVEKLTNKKGLEIRMLRDYNKLIQEEVKNSKKNIKIVIKIVLTFKKIKRNVFCFNYNSIELRLLIKCLSFRIPGAEFSNKYQEHHWDGRIKKFNKRRKSFSYGLWEYVERALKKNKIKYEFQGNEDQDISWIKFSKQLLPPERDYQREAIKVFFKKRIGIIKIPTRGGKTFVASEIIRLILERKPGSIILFLTDSTDLFSQAINDISKFLNLYPEEIGKIKGNVFDLKNINVAMCQTIQSIYRNKEKHPEKYKKILLLLNSVVLGIVDEVHEFSKSKFKIGLIRRLNSEYLLSLSATPLKDDKIAAVNVKEITGGIIYEIKEEKLIERGVIAENKVLLLYLKHERQVGTYSKLVERLIIKNKQRNEIILKVVAFFNENNIKTLLITNNITHGRMLSKKSGYPFISGIDTVDRRELEKNNFLKGNNNILFSSYIYKKGITLPEAQILLNISGGFESSLITQIRGRVTGVTEKKKKSLFVDFIDNEDRYFCEHSLHRIKTYEKLVGAVNIEIFDMREKNILELFGTFCLNWLNK
jgi:superfamily II DNA or RNA helicase